MADMKQPAMEEGVTNKEAMVASGNLESGTVLKMHIDNENKKRDKKHKGDEPVKRPGGIS